MTNNPLTGAQYMMRGLQLIMRPGLRRFVLIPILINTIVFSLLAWLGVSQFEAFMDYLLPEDSWFAFIRWLLWPLFVMALVLVIIYTFTTLANLIAGPFNGLLAEQVERVLSGQEPEQTTGNLWKEILPSLLSELRKLGYFLLRAVPLLVLFIIPVVNVAAPFIWLAFNAWFLALEYADYPMGNHGLKFPEQHARLKSVRLTSLGFGGGATVLTMIPVLNFVAMPAAVAGATVLWHEQFKQGDTALKPQ
jgi:CysZ protein